MKKAILSTFVVACFALTASPAMACPSSTAQAAPAKKMASKNIVDTAVKAGSFKTLLAAVKAAGLAGILQGKGPFTVFAPTDTAFARLPKGTIAKLLKNKKKLAAILKYHVVAGKVLAKDVIKLKSAKTVNGKSATIRIVNGKVLIDGAVVSKTDIKCSNGVIHVIDAVIIPPASPKKLTRK